MRFLVIDEKRALSKFDIKLIENHLGANISFCEIDYIDEKYDETLHDFVLLVSVEEALSSAEIELKCKKKKCLKVQIEEVDFGLKVVKRIEKFLGLIKKNKMWFQLSYDAALASGGAYSIYEVKKDGGSLTIHEGNSPSFNKKMESSHERGVKSFYMRFDEFHDYFFYMQKKLTQVGSVKGHRSDKFVILVTVVELIQEKIRTYGADQDLFNAIEGISNFIGEQLDDGGHVITETLSKLSKSRLLHEHSLLIAFIAPFVGSKRGLNMEEFVPAIVYASLFHDIVFDENESFLLKIRSRSQLKELGWREVKKVKTHPLEAVSLLRSCHIRSEMAEKMIMCHHELPDGKGFPNGLTYEDISYESSLFIIAEEFSVRLYGRVINTQTMKEIIEELEGRYMMGAFSKVISDFYSLCNEQDRQMAI